MVDIASTYLEVVNLHRSRLRLWWLVGAGRTLPAGPRASPSHYRVIRVFRQADSRCERRGSLSAYLVAQLRFQPLYKISNLVLFCHGIYLAEQLVESSDVLV